MTDPIYTPPRLRITKTWPVADGETPETVEVEVHDGPVTAAFLIEVLAALERKTETTHIHVGGQISMPSRGAAVPALTDIAHLEGRLR